MDILWCKHGNTRREYFRFIKIKHALVTVLHGTSSQKGQLLSNTNLGNIPTMHIATSDVGDRKLGIYLQELRFQIK